MEDPFVGFSTLGTELSRFTEAESAEKAPPASMSMTQAGPSLDSTSTNLLIKSLITQANNHDGHNKTDLCLQEQPGSH